MNLNSLIHRTDLIFSKYGGVVTEKENYIVVSTPSNPGFHWGNYIIFTTAPNSGESEDYIKIFKREQKHYKNEFKHIAITWDQSEASKEVIKEFELKNYQYELGVCLHADTLVKPPKLIEDLDFKTIESEDEWEQVIQLQIKCSNPLYAGPSLEPFKRSQFKQYQEMQNKGIGEWFGVIENGQIVADLGLFTDGTLGRYQNVGTHPDFRRRGLCQSLVYHAGKYMQDKHNLQKLVIAADTNYFAYQIYESVGFKNPEFTGSFCWWERN